MVTYILHFESFQSNVILSPEQLSDNKGMPITEWVTKELTRRTIMSEFRRFLLEFVDAQGESVYGPLIRSLGESNKESLEVNYRHLSQAKATLAYFVVNAPQEVLKMFDTIAFEVVQMEYPDYGRIHAEIHVRITDLPIISTLRDLRYVEVAPESEKCFLGLEFRSCYTYGLWLLIILVKLT